MLDRLSVVIPAWNEARRIRATLERIVAWALPLSWWEILVVDDGSTDATAAIVSDLCAREPRVSLVSMPRNRGKGFCVRRGMRDARGDLRLVTDADLSAPIEEATKLYARVADGADIAIGSRGLSESNIVRRQPIYRETLGKTFNLLVRTLLPTDIRDTQCGFKLFTARAAEECFSRARIDRFAFDAEIVAIAGARGLRIDEVPVTWEHSPPSTVGLVGDSSRMLWDLVRIRSRSRTRWRDR